MDNEIIKKIESNEDFKILIEEVIQKTKLEIKKYIFDTSVYNSNRQLMISYYENERKKLLKKIKKDSWSLRVIFNNDNIKINKEDLNQLFFYTNTIYDYLELINGYKYNKEHYLEELEKEKKDLFKFHKLRLNDIKNNIWLAYLNLNIEELKGGLKSGYNSLIFDKKESEEFFIYIVNNWLKEEVNSFTALQFVFTKMWFKNNDKETIYKIISTQPYFASNYWSVKYSDIHKISNIKNPKLNKDNFTDYYHKRFKKHFNEFTGV